MIAQNTSWDPPRWLQLNILLIFCIMMMRIITQVQVCKVKNEDDEGITFLCMFYGSKRVQFLESCENLHHSKVGTFSVKDSDRS